MSTKNLARTAIECGRPGESQWGCRLDNRAGRARARQTMRAIVDAASPEGASTDDWTLPPFRKTNRVLDDKLNPPKRWLAHQVGRPWDRVRSEIHQRFDARTTAGRHIIDHLLAWVDERGARLHRACSSAVFRVDGHGILRDAIRKN
jgi:hypothetical protein